MEKTRKFLLNNIVPITFFILSILAISIANVSFNFIANELYRRIIRNIIMVTALVIPIIAGMGINFSIILGALSAQCAIIFVVDKEIYGIEGFIITLIISILISIIIGNIIGYIINKSKGREMITSLVIGLLGTSIYNLIFMVGYGSIIKPKNSSIMLSNGLGIQSMVDVFRLKEVILEYKFIPILCIVLVTSLVLYLLNSKFGTKLKVIGENMNNAYALGIDVDKNRRYAIAISTVLASIGQITFILDIGTLNVYTGHLNIDIFASAALLAGGATMSNANLKNVFIGVVLFHTLFIVSPLAGKQLFQNAALGEYFRSFVAYSTIVFSLMMNIKKNDSTKSSI